MDVHSRGLLRALGVLIGFACLNAPALAQQGPRVEVTNRDDNPVPVVPAGRFPYQLVYDVSAFASEGCDLIPVPAGMVLTIQSIGVEATVDVSDLVDVYVVLGRDDGSSLSIFRFGDSLNLVSATNSARQYRGILNMNILTGPSTGSVGYRAAICIASAPAGADVVNSARGVLSGYVEPAVIIDGNSLQ